MTTHEQTWGWRTAGAAAAVSALLGLTGAAGAQLSQGPDVTYSNMTSINSYGPVGGVRAYIFGSNTCNIGNQNLLWTNNGTPGLAMNMFRLHNGRLMQIGLGNVKTACCAAVSNGCGLGCNGAGGSVLGAGCLDVYSAGWNAGQSRLAPRSAINPWTGQYSAYPGTTGDAVFRRLQVLESDLSPVNFPGALFFGEGLYIATDDAEAGNWANNASYRRLTFSGFSAQLADSMQVGQPAIMAWRAHGRGLNIQDPDVIIQTVDVPGEGRFYVAAKVTALASGQWRYDYAVYNQNSHRAGSSWSVPLPPNTTVTDVGFNAPFYHSGEVFDNTPWVVEQQGGQIRWRSPQTALQNPNTNALRWGTMYNFWFTADRAPGDGQAVLGLFRAGTPDSLQVTLAIPVGGVTCQADWNEDEALNSQDIAAFITSWLASVHNGTLEADFDGNGTVNSVDISVFISVWLAEISDGC